MVRRLGGSSRSPQGDGKWVGGGTICVLPQQSRLSWQSRCRMQRRNFARDQIWTQDKQSSVGDRLTIAPPDSHKRTVWGWVGWDGEGACALFSWTVITEININSSQTKKSPTSVSSFEIILFLVRRLLGMYVNHIFQGWFAEKRG